MADTYQNPNDAYRATMHALQLFSDNFEKACQPIRKSSCSCGENTEDYSSNYIYETMRKLLIAILFVVCAANLSAQKNPFEQFTEMDGVTSVYISKNMLSLFPKTPKIIMGA